MDPVEYDNAFRSFIRSLLIDACGLTEAHADRFVVPANMVRFRRAFTHVSVHPYDNYEAYEFRGDGIVNEFVPFYIGWRFPEITSINWLSKLKAVLIGKKFLAHLAGKAGFGQFVLYRTDDEISARQPPVLGRGTSILNPKSKEYLSILEDVTEALTACIVDVVTSAGFTHGSSIEVCHRLLSFLFGREIISTRYEDIFDPITRMKQLYEQKGKPPWPIKHAYQVADRGANNFEVTVYGWPLGDRVANQNNLTEVGHGRGYTRDEALQNAASNALTTLKNTYNIREVQIDKTQR